MRATYYQMAAAAALALSAGAAQASLLYLAPPAGAVGPHQQVEVGVFVSGQPEALGAFEFRVNFDRSILSLLGLRFGTALGTVGSDAYGFLDLAGDGSGSAGEISFLSLAELNALQADNLAPSSQPLLLGTLLFQTRSTGNSPLRFTGGGLSNSFGLNLRPLEAFDASLQVVPEPGTLALLGLGLSAGLAAGMGRSRWRAALKTVADRLRRTR